MNLFFDTSVIASLYIHEKISSKSREIIEYCLINNINVYCSDLVNYELGNTLQKNNVKDQSPMMKKFRTTFYNIVPYSSILEEMAFIQATEYGLTYYDAIHVSSAKIGSGFLVTNDKEILKKVNIAIDVDEVKLLMQRLFKESS
jgi:predicted nucleic acid-binding protein